MVNPESNAPRLMLGGIGRKTGSVALAAMLSLSMVPSLAFADKLEADEAPDQEQIETTAQAETPAPASSTDEAAVETNAAPSTTPETENNEPRTGNANNGTKQEAPAEDIAQATPEAAKPSVSPAAEEDADNEQPTAEPQATVTELVAGKTYTAPMSLVKSDGSTSTAAQFFDQNALLARTGTGYKVTITVNKSGLPYITSIEGATSLGEGKYALDATSISDDIHLKFALTTPMGAMNQSCLLKIDTANITEQTTTENPTPEQPSVDKSKLQAAIDEAKAIQKGSKTDDAWNALQAAIAQGEAALNNPRIPQQGIDGMTGALRQAIATFNESANVSTTPDNPSTDENQKPSTDENKKPVAEEGAVKTPGGFMLVPNKTYDVKASTTSDMINSFGLLSEDATVVWNGKTYEVTIGFQGAAAGALKSVSYNGNAAKALDNNRYSFKTSDITKPMTLSFSLGSPAPEMTVEGDIVLDTATLPTASGKPIESEEPKDDNKKDKGTNSSNNSNKTDRSTSSAKAARFQVGHTYRVPIKFTKENGSETSMAAKYFGGTAIVRPKSNGTFDVTFAATSDGLQYITSLKHKGKNLSRSGDQFTVNIPAADRDTVVPIEMDITMLKSMGINDPVTSDLHLYLSRAEDLGTSAGSTKASSNPTLAQTGDEQDAAGLVALATLAAGAAVAAGRRRLEDLSE